MQNGAPEIVWVILKTGRAALLKRVGSRLVGMLACAARPASILQPLELL